MFVKKGPLAKVWIAAHFHRKLNKAHVQGTDINLSAKSILDPAAPIALRLSGQLLLGLVRIYQRKVKYLQEDCSDALTKMKMIFRSGMVDLPPDASIAQHNQITLPDNSERMDYAIPEMALETLDAILMKPLSLERDTGSDSLPRLDSFTASREEITLKEPGLDLDDFDLLADGKDDLLPDAEHDIFGTDVLIQPLHDDKSASDVEMGRDAKEMQHGEILEDFDIAVGEINYALGEDNKDDSSSVIAADLSGLETTTDAGKSDEEPQQKEEADHVSGDAPIIGEGGEQAEGGFPEVGIQEDVGGVDDVANDGAEMVGDAGEALPPPEEEAEDRIDEDHPLEDGGSPDQSPHQSPQQDETITLAHAHDPPIPGQQPKLKKRRVEKRDERTELSGKIISTQLKDTSDIIAKRDTIPMTKRAKLRHYCLNTTFADMTQVPSALPGRYEVQDTSFFAPELMQVFQRTSCLGPLPVPLKELSELELARKAMEEKVREEMEDVEEFPDVMEPIFADGEKVADDEPEVPEEQQPPGDIDVSLPAEDIDVSLTSVAEGGDITIDGADPTIDPPQENVDEIPSGEIPDGAPVEDIGFPDGALVEDIIPMEDIPMHEDPFTDETKDPLGASEEFKRHLQDLGDDDKQIRDDIFGDSSSQSAKNSSSSEEKDDHETRYGWSRRTRKMHQWLDREMQNKEKMSFESLGDMSAKTAASVFYQLLVLKTHSYISVEQEEAYGDILISKDNFRTPIVST